MPPGIASGGFTARKGTNKEATMAKKSHTKSTMTPKAASRIQSHADASGTNQSFKSRAQSAAAKSTSTSGKGGKK